MPPSPLWSAIAGSASLCLMLAAASGCGADIATGGGGGAGAGGFSWPAYCDARAMTCGAAASACKGQEACARSLLRDEVEAALLACLQASCDEDACLAQVAAQFPPTPAGQAFAGACQAYLTKCPGGNDDVCAAPGFVADDALAVYQACFDAPACADVATCIDAVNAERVDPCQDWL